MSSRSRPRPTASACGSSLPPSCSAISSRRDRSRVEGVSLTVAAVDGTGFEIALIPHTLAETTLSALAGGSLVNLEIDVLAKYVEKLLPGTMPR